MAYQTIITDEQDSVMQITLNRPEKLNALSYEVLEELSQAFSVAEANSAIKVLVITGQGKAFCAGADIKELAVLDGDSGVAFAKKGQAVCRQLEQLSKPSLAVVNGYAFGGGCELATSASLRIAAATALFAQPEVKLGVIPGYGGTQRLARLVGKGRALDLCMTGRKITAETALNWGLISAVAESGDLMTEMKHWLDMLLSQSPHAIRQVLAAVHTAYDLPLAEALTVEALCFGLSCAHADKEEGVSAFINKRQAKFNA